MISPQNKQNVTAISIERCQRTIHLFEPERWEVRVNRSNETSTAMTETSSALLPTRLFCDAVVK
jgi:hypothetical protein